MQGTNGIGNSTQNTTHNKANGEPNNETYGYSGIEQILDMATSEIATIASLNASETTLMPMFDRNIVEGIHGESNQPEPVNKLGITTKIERNQDGECILIAKVNSGPFRPNNLTKTISKTNDGSETSQAVKILKEKYNVDKNSSAEEILAANDKIAETLASKLSQPQGSTMEDIRVNLLICLSEMLEKRVTPALQKHIPKNNIQTLLDAMNAREPQAVKGVSDVAKYVAHRMAEEEESSKARLKNLELNTAAIIFKKEPILISESENKNINTLTFVLKNKIEIELLNQTSADQVDLKAFLVKTFSPKNDVENAAIRTIIRKFDNSFYNFKEAVNRQSEAAIAGGEAHEPTMELPIKNSFTILSKNVLVSQDELNVASNKISEYASVKDWPEIETSSIVGGGESDASDADSEEYHELYQESANQMKSFFSDECLLDISKRIAEIKEARTKPNIDPQTLKRLNRELFQLEGLKSDSKYISRMNLEVNHQFQAFDMTRLQMLSVKAASIGDISGAVASIITNSKSRGELQQAIPNMLKNSVPQILQIISKEVQTWKTNNPVLIPAMTPPLLIMIATIIHQSGGGGSGGGSSNGASASANLQAYVASLKQILTTGQSVQQIQQQVTKLMSTVLPNNQPMVAYLTNKFSEVIVAQNLAANLTPNNLPPDFGLKVQIASIITALLFGLISAGLNLAQFKMSKEFYFKIMQMISDNDVKLEDIGRRLDECEGMIQMIAINANTSAKETTVRIAEKGQSANVWKKLIESELSKSFKEERGKNLTKANPQNQKTQQDIARNEEKMRKGVDKFFAKDPEKMIMTFCGKKLKSVSSGINEVINSRINAQSGASSISEKLSTMLSIEPPPKTRVGALATKENSGQAIMKALSNPRSKLEMLTPFDEIEGETAVARSKRVEYGTKWQISRMKFMQKMVNNLRDKDYEAGMIGLRDAEEELKADPNSYFGEQKRLMQNYNISTHKSIKSFMTLLQAKSEINSMEKDINLKLFLTEEMRKLNQKIELMECKNSDDNQALIKTKDAIAKNCRQDLQRKKEILKYISYRIAEKQQSACKLLGIDGQVYTTDSDREEIILTTQFFDALNNGIINAKKELIENVNELNRNETLLNDRGMYSKTRIKVYGDPSNGKLTADKKRPSLRMRSKVSIPKLFQPNTKAIRNELDKTATMINITTPITEDGSRSHTSHIKLYIKQAGSTDKAAQKKREHFRKKDSGMISRFVL